MKYLINILPNIFKIVPLFMLLFMANCQQQDRSNAYKQIVEAYVDVWNTGNLDALDSITDPQFELRIPPNFIALKGRDSLKKVISQNRTAYPDFHLTINDEDYYGDRVVIARWTIAATNTGPGSHPPTGKRVTSKGFSVVFIDNGKISGEWIAYSDLDWSKQLGFTLAPSINQK